MLAYSHDSCLALSGRNLVFEVIILAQTESSSAIHVTRGATPSPLLWASNVTVLGAHSLGIMAKVVQQLRVPVRLSEDTLDEQESSRSV